MKLDRIRLDGLWKKPDFLLLWSGQTVSVFGSMIGGSAMSFTAILALQASPFQMGVLQALGLLPAFLIGLFAGAWVDRLRRRPLLIAADLGRAVFLAAIPLAALLGALRIELVFAVALVVSLLTIIFDVSYQSYLPGLVSKDELVEGNSKLAASAAVAEVGGFGLAGTLVQLFSAPLTILIDAGSFLVSAASIALIRTPEPKAVPSEQPDMRREIAAGLGVVWAQPLLRASAITTLILGLSSGIFGAQVVLYMSRGLGFAPGVLTVMWAVGGVSSLMGAVLVPRVNRWLGAGRAMTLGLAVSAFTRLLIVLASGANLLSAALLVAAQLGDGFHLTYEINQVSLRQGLVAGQVLGRVNATLHFLSLGGTLLGALAGGGLGELIGPRATLLVGALLTGAAALVLGFSPLHGYIFVPEVEAEPAD